MLPAGLYRIASRRGLVRGCLNVTSKGASIASSGEAVRRTGGGVSGLNLKKSFPVPLGSQSYAPGPAVQTMLNTLRQPRSCRRPKLSQQRPPSSANWAVGSAGGGVPALNLKKPSQSPLSLWERVGESANRGEVFPAHQFASRHQSPPQPLAMKGMFQRTGGVFPVRTWQRSIQIPYSQRTGLSDYSPT